MLTMPADHAPTTKRKHASGKTQPEATRARPTVSTRLDRHQLARVEELAADSGTTRHGMLAQLIGQALDLAAPTPNHSRSSTTAA